MNIFGVKYEWDQYGNKVWGTNQTEVGAFRIFGQH